MAHTGANSRSSRISAAMVLAAVLICIHGTVWPVAASDLETARLKLAAALAAVESVQAKFDALQSAGGMSATEADDYRDYLGRLRQVVIDNCKKVLTLKAIDGDDTAEPGCTVVQTGPMSFPGESTEEERIAGLDRQLGSSLSEFDELLLREMEELKRRQSSAPDTADGAGTGGDGEGGDGQGEGEGADQAQGRQGEGSSDRGQGEDQSGTAQQGTDQTGDEQTAAVDQTGPQQSGNRGGVGTGGPLKKSDEPPPDDDDDIVARQLREAAENETDPVLREKLWEEYRRYKSGQKTNTKKSKNQS